ncbi:hypothetical protein PTKIN_Ptkin02bG0157700 [Pterospermum kingtungense]
MSQAQSQLNLENDHLSFAFSPIPQYVVEDLDSKDLGDDGSKSLTTRSELVIFMLAMPIAILFSLYCLLDQQFRLHAPTLHPESFSLTRFNNVSDSNPMALSIDIDLTFGCKDCDYETFFDRTNGTIMYKEDRAFSTVSVEPFGLRKMELKTVHIKFASSGNDGENTQVEKEILKEIEKDLKNGTVHLSLRIDNQVSFKKWGELWDGANPGVNSYCWDLAVRFSATPGLGRLVGGGQKQCW